MRIINNILWIEFQELVDCGVSEHTIKGAKRDGSLGWSFCDDPADHRRVLIQYEPLKPRYKQLIEAKFGNPYKFMEAVIIKTHLVSKQSDVDFIMNYRLPDGTHLSKEHQTAYITACKYLNFLSECTAKSVKSLGFASVKAFNDAVISLIKAEEVSLPSAYPKLKEKVRLYKEQGPECVISKRFGNKNRFTNSLGGSVYNGSDGSIPDYVLDHYQRIWDGSDNVLAWYTQVNSSFVNWPTAMSDVLSLSVAGFNDWFLPNYRQAHNMCYNGTGTPAFYYPPFNISSSWSFWTSETPNGGSSNAYFMTTLARTAVTAKSTTSNMRFIACRKHTF